MFERAQANKITKAFEYWAAFVQGNLDSLTLSPDATLLEILYKWTVSRYGDFFFCFVVYTVSIVSAGNQ